MENIVAEWKTSLGALASNVDRILRHPMVATYVFFNLVGGSQRKLHPPRKQGGFGESRVPRLIGGPPPSGQTDEDDLAIVIVGSSNNENGNEEERALPLDDGR